MPDTPGRWFHESVVNRRTFATGFGALVAFRSAPGFAQGAHIAPQPYFAMVQRAIAALTAAGQPIAAADAERLDRLTSKEDGTTIMMAEAILDRYTLVSVTLDENGDGEPRIAGAPRRLIEQGWTRFLVRVANSGGLTDTFNVTSINDRGWDQSLGNNMGFGRFTGDQRAGLIDTVNPAALVSKLSITPAIAAPSKLSGFDLEYLIIDVFSRDSGRVRALFGFGAGVKVINLGLVNRSAASSFGPVALDFDAAGSRDVHLSVLDSDDIGCMASLIITDHQRRVYPAQTMRLAPDMAFHPHIYRADGETVRLPDGDYQVSSWRGPEYLRGRQSIRVSAGSTRIAIKLERWIDPARWGWYSGDTHIHASGCAHYMHPSEGVSPETMIRHARGEGLAIGNVLTWGPSWYYQKQFFSGHAVSPPASLEHPELQRANNASLRPRPTRKDHQTLLRYDLEISGFPSSMSGHLVLLRLKEQDYPGTKAVEDWPSWNLPILAWAKQQGAIAGYAHCAAGMQTKSDVLPNYEIPRFNSIGTNEAIVDVTHGLCDFLSGCEARATFELNSWYHMLNCGYRLAMLGETDYPCIYDERPGVGRSYVKLDHRPLDDAGYNAWIEGIRAGRLYCGDGRSHFLRCSVDDRPPHTDIALPTPKTVAINTLIAARLELVAPKTSETGPYAWHIEHARIPGTGSVPVELVVNGEPVERVALIADGKPRPIRFRTQIKRSSWVALRILPSGHTHPIFVTVGGRPIRASRRSAEWLRACVDALWSEKNPLMRESERPAAAQAYDHARKAYDAIIAESKVR